MQWTLRIRLATEHQISIRISNAHHSAQTVKSRYTSGLGHLLSIQQQVTIAAHAPRPLLRLVLPDGRVVVQGKTEMVVDQVLA